VKKRPDIVESAARLGPGCGGRHPSSGEIIGAFVEVKCHPAIDLAIDLAIEGGGAKEIAKPREPAHGDARWWRPSLSSYT
jgi:hypothetical protein